MSVCHCLMYITVDTCKLFCWSQSRHITVADLSHVSQDEADDDYFEDGNLFSRLEEIRAHLEKELGLEILREAYEAVQVLCDFIPP